MARRRPHPGWQGNTQATQTTVRTLRHDGDGWCWSVRRATTGEEIASGKELTRDVARRESEKVGVTL